MGKGTVICAGCILTTNIKMGNHVQINLDCTIGHDVIMDDYATLAPGVHVSGYVSLGKRVYVGTGQITHYSRSAKNALMYIIRPIAPFAKNLKKLKKKYPKIKNDLSPLIENLEQGFFNLTRPLNR